MVRKQCTFDQNSQNTPNNIGNGFYRGLRLWYNLEQETQIPEPSQLGGRLVREFALRRASRRVLYVLPVGYCFVSYRQQSTCYCTGSIHPCQHFRTEKRR